MRVSKTKPPHLYINILDFKDEIEHEIIFKKVQELVNNFQSKIRVYGQ